MLIVQVTMFTCPGTSIWGDEVIKEINVRIAVRNRSYEVIYRN
jgi:hypothetical protein